MTEATGVCQVISSFHPVVGGAEVATGRLARGLASSGAPTAVLTRRQPGQPGSEVRDGVHILRAGLPLSGKLGSLSFGLHGLLALAGPLRSYGTLHVQNLDTPLLLGLLGRRWLGRKLVITPHAEGDIERKSASASGQMRLRRMAEAGDRFVAISPAIESALASLGVDQDRIARIPNGVDTEAIRPADAAGRAEARSRLLPGVEPPVLLFVGRLVPLKRLDVLLDALSHPGEAGVAAMHLAVVGDGPSRSEWEAHAASRGLAVTWVGNRSEVSEYLQAADMFALPSDKEGLPVALMEAMAAGLPCVVSDLPGTRALIDDGVNGRVVKPGAASEWASALAELASDAALREALGSSARRHIEDRYSLSDVVRRHRELYGELG